MTAVQFLRRPVQRLRPLPGRQRIVRWGRDVRAAQLSAGARALTWVVSTLGGLALWLVVFAFGLSGLQEGHDQHSLYARFRAELAAGTAPLGGAIARGAPVALLSSSSGGLDQVTVVEGARSGDLLSGPGHVPGGALPGQAGYCVVMGRSTSYGAPFGSIASLARGAVIVATTGQGVFHYVVEDVRRGGDPFPPALKPGGGRLTLVTAEGSGWAGSLMPAHAVYVDALLTDKSVPAPGGTTSITDADGVLRSDSSGMYPMILWLQLLVAALVGIVWSGARWGRLQAWLVGAPIALAALWGATAEAWLLLPNLL